MVTYFLCMKWSNGIFSVNKSWPIFSEVRRQIEKLTCSVQLCMENGLVDVHEQVRSFRAMRGWKGFHDRASRCNGTDIRSDVHRPPLPPRSASQNAHKLSYLHSATNRLYQTVLHHTTLTATASPISNPPFAIRGKWRIFDEGTLKTSLTTS